MVQLLGVEDYARRKCHHLRRGHAKDIQVRGANLYEFLATGQLQSLKVLAHQTGSSGKDGV